MIVLFKVHIALRGGNFDYEPETPKEVAAPMSLS